MTNDNDPRLPPAPIAATEEAVTQTMKQQTCNHCTLYVDQHHGINLWCPDDSGNRWSVAPIAAGTDENRISNDELDLFADWKPGKPITIDMNTIGFLIREVVQDRKLLKAAFHGLSSYQYGNSSTELAEEMADKISEWLEGGR